mgnify:CR=1 FL=1
MNWGKFYKTYKLKILLLKTQEERQLLSKYYKEQKGLNKS